MSTLPSFAPEADLLEVAEHNFSGLSMPLLVACYDWDQFEEFVFREGLMCSEVRRLDFKAACRNFPEDKVLLLLPGWDMHRATKDVVDRWIFVDDRYTVELRTPRPRIKRGRRALVLLIAACFVLWGMFFTWLILR